MDLKDETGGMTVAMMPVEEHEQHVAELHAVIAALALKFGGGIVPLYEDDLNDTRGQQLFIDFGKPLSGLTVRVVEPSASVEKPLPAPTHIGPRTMQ